MLVGGIVAIITGYLEGMVMYTNSSKIAEHTGDMPIDDVLTAVSENHRADLPLLTEVEQRQLAAWNATQHDYPQDACIPQLVAMQAAATPDAVALVAGDQILSYRELNQRAN